MRLVVAGRFTGDVIKRLVEIGGGGEAASLGDLQLGQIGGLEHLHRFLHPLDGDIIPWGDAVEFFENGREVGGGHARHVSDLPQSQLMLEIFIDIADRPLEAAGGGGGGIERLFGIDIIIVSDDVDECRKKNVFRLDGAAGAMVGQLALQRPDQLIQRAVADGDAVAEIFVAGGEKIE